MAMGTMWDNDQALDDWEGFTTDDWTDQAMAFIDEPSDQPFFIQMAYNAVHNFAWQLPPEELEKRGLLKIRRGGGTFIGDVIGSVFCGRIRLFVPLQ